MLSETRDYSKSSLYHIKRTRERKASLNLLVMQSCHQSHLRHFIRLAERSSQPAPVYCSGGGVQQTPIAGTHTELLQSALELQRNGLPLPPGPPAPITATEQPALL